MTSGYRFGTKVGYWPISICKRTKIEQKYLLEGLNFKDIAKERFGVSFCFGE